MLEAEKMLCSGVTFTLTLALGASALSAPLASQMGAPPVSARGQSVQPERDALSVRSELKASYQRLARAIKSKNLDAYSALHAPTFSVTLPDGTSQTGQQVEENMRKAMSQSRGAPHIAFSITKVDVAGDVATVTVRQQHQGVVATTIGTTVRSRGWILSRDTWVKSADGWKQKQIVVLDGRTRLNGKVYDPYARRAIGPLQVPRKPSP